MSFNRLSPASPKESKFSGLRSGSASHLYRLHRCYGIPEGRKVHPPGIRHFTPATYSSTIMPTIRTFRPSQKACTRAPHRRGPCHHRQTRPTRVFHLFRALTPMTPRLRHRLHLHRLHRSLQTRMATRSGKARATKIRSHLESASADSSHVRRLLLPHTFHQTRRLGRQSADHDTGLRSKREEAATNQEAGGEEQGEWQQRW